VGLCGERHEAERKKQEFHAGRDNVWKDEPAGRYPLSVSRGC
jgi:hypothetical protein